MPATTSPPKIHIEMQNRATNYRQPKKPQRLPTTPPTKMWNLKVSNIPSQNAFQKPELSDNIPVKIRISPNVYRNQNVGNNINSQKPYGYPIASNTSVPNKEINLIVCISPSRTTSADHVSVVIDFACYYTLSRPSICRSLKQYEYFKRLKRDPIRSREKGRYLLTR